MIAISARMAGRGLGLALVGLLLAAPMAEAAEVTVHRGAQVTVESTDKQTRAAGTTVVVQRGRVAPPAAPARVVEQAPRISFSAGEEVWLVDRKTGKLVVCELRRTPDFGRNKIRCTRRSIAGILR